MIFLGLGSNIGDRILHLKTACELIEQKIGVITSKSSVYETAAWGNTDQNTFLNQVVLVERRWHPIDILDTILKIEIEMGRIRDEKWGPRIIDIDLIYYDNVIVKMSNLTLPHPYIQDRKFVLEPLVEIAPDFIHPKLKKTNLDLLNECQDKSEVLRLVNRPII
jgi:2-amino-4-hydroxy-6-hydroxymethyldihydropteridine diphosphokinase